MTSEKDMKNILDQIKKCQTESTFNESKEDIKISKIKKIITFYFKYIHWAVAILFYSSLIYFGINYILGECKMPLFSFTSSLVLYLLYDIFLLNKFSKINK